MTRSEQILVFLTQQDEPLCDDCVGKGTKLDRHNVNACCRGMTPGQIVREETTCAWCGRYKICNQVRDTGEGSPQTAGLGDAIAPSRSDTITNKKMEFGDRPWYWEGNVQAVLVDWLRAGGYTILQAVDTPSRQPGVDVIAEQASMDLTLWVSVKGWPEKSVHTQARHWFAEGLFDLVRYRSAQGDITLAVALPRDTSGVGITYVNLLPRVSWLRTALPFKIFWIAPDGKVKDE